jgi:glycyl-tRNA synthetase beta chain
MVYEFGVLQGIVGREYAAIEGEKKAVAQAIFEHYLPRFSGDRLPEGEEGIAISLADKLDSLVAAFSLGLIPTGSQDPYGLRRSAQGVAEILIRKRLDLSLDEMIGQAYENLKSQFDLPHNLIKVKEQLLSFIAQRIRNLLLDEKVRYDIADAALSGLDNAWQAYQTAKVMMKAMGQDWFPGIVTTADRVKRLAANAKKNEINPEDFIEEGERGIFIAYQKIQNELEQLLIKKDYEASIKLLSDLTAPVDDFFVKVLIMHEEPKIKDNRLAILKSLENLFTKVADFSLVVQ